MDKIAQYEGDDVEVPLNRLAEMLKEADKLGIDLNLLIVEEKPVSAKFNAATVNYIKRALLEGHHYRKSEVAAGVIQSAHCGKKPDAPFY